MAKLICTCTLDDGNYHHVHKSCPLHKVVYRTRPWKVSEIEFLKENYRKLGIARCSARLQRQAGSVQNTAQKLELLQKNPFEKYSQSEINFLLEHDDKTPQWCAEQLGRSVAGIHVKRRSLGIYQRGKIGERRRITAGDIAFIQKNAHRGVTFIATFLGISITRVRTLSDRHNIQIAFIGRGRQRKED